MQLNEGQWVKSICVGTGRLSGLTSLLNVIEPDPPHLVRVVVVLVAHHTTKSSQMVQMVLAQFYTNWPLVIKCKGCLNFYGIFGHCLIL